jgi:radical SAM/Cys-rich protein
MVDMAKQVAAREDALTPEASFSDTLERHKVELVRGEATILQVNVGLRCNQACRHCHLEAGPDRREMMGRKTIEDTIAYVERSAYQVVDITGGAPELNPHLPVLLERLSSLTPRIMLRSNLTALTEEEHKLVEVCRRHRVVIVASLPSLHPAQTDAQRGRGALERSVQALQSLNAAGYGKPDTDLQLDLVSNPTGAFLPVSQEQAEKKFKRDLERRWGIVFNRLYTFANVPLGRYRTWLRDSGNLANYLNRLVSRFNPCTVSGLMCRTLVSVNWEGYLFDCDFNLARGLFMGGRRIHISGMAGKPAAGEPIAVSEHCFACTAGSGFT